MLQNSKQELVGDSIKGFFQIRLEEDETTSRHLRKVEGEASEVEIVPDGPAPEPVRLITTN